jgi:hypothetical protein
MIITTNKSVEKQVAIYFIRRYTGLTNVEIGKIFKMRAQAVSKAGIKIERLMEENRKIRNKVKKLISIFQGGPFLSIFYTLVSLLFPVFEIAKIKGDFLYGRNNYDGIKNLPSRKFWLACLAVHANSSSRSRNRTGSHSLQEFAPKGGGGCAGQGSALPGRAGNT